MEAFDDLCTQCIATSVLHHLLEYSCLKYCALIGQNCGTNLKLLSSLVVGLLSVSVVARYTKCRTYSKPTSYMQQVLVYALVLAQ